MGCMSSIRPIRARVRDGSRSSRYRKDHSRKRVTARYLQQQFDVVEICRDWLVAYNNKALLESLQEEGETT